MTKEDCIKRGYDLTLCTFEDNGNLAVRKEWNRDHTVLDVIRIYYKDGTLCSAWKWDEEKKETYLFFKRLNKKINI